ncbi:acyltransferase [Bacillus sp. ISL-18]|uniref:acyltransferase family protein n=1 Tax=Bacillus sp. ISL-18 TaxID=2819118 RepID=UPI001BE903E8|nr:acyltransferase [Bacillus sp. ISL-18]MBT2658617.1 acyltransferase [Bacillus sp. ISL-18]
MNGRSLSSFDLRKNNFDIIRFIAAISVIFSHSFPLTLGFDESEPLMRLSNNQTGFGHLAVIIFFIISGFLITQSFENSSGFWGFSKARVLRIFPALIVMLLLTVFVLGPLLTTLPITGYFSDMNTWKYLFLNISLIGVQYDLPGVFKFNIFPISVNGSLWTLWFEFFFYFVVAFLGILKLLNKKLILGSFALCLVATSLKEFTHGIWYLEYLYKYVSLFVYFNAGALFYLFRKEIKLDSRLAITSLIGVIVGTYLGFFDYVFPVLGTYLLFFLSFQTNLQFSNFTKYGDFSYGLYIFAFPIQQTVTHYFNNQLSPVENFIISLPITLIISILSWHLIEKNAMKLKKRTIIHGINKKEIA